MSDRTDPTKPWNKNIIRNLRQKYGEAIMKYTDKQILKTYDDWSMSTKEEAFPVWCKEWDT